MNVWATNLKGLMKLDKKEKSLVPNAQTVYARPPTILNMVTNYRSFSKKSLQEEHSVMKTGGSRKCGKCGLCGNHGKLNSMVVESDEIVRKDGVRIRIKQRIDCRDGGIYVAKCRVCEEVYVGQTSNRFSCRWNGHRAVWKEMVAKGKIGYKHSVEYNDGCALFLHYAKSHEEALWKGKNTSGMEISEAYEVIFVEKVTGRRLDTAESFWITKVNAKININKTYLPRVK